MRFRLRTLFIATSLFVLCVWITHSILSIDSPIAEFVVCDDSSIELNDENAIFISEAALRHIDFDFVHPVAAFGNNEKYVGRNSASANRVFVIWKVRNQRYAEYTVRIEKTESSIMAKISANWLQ